MSKSEQEFNGKINLVREMNEVIRKNIVQAVPTAENNLREETRSILHDQPVYSA